MRVLLPFVTTLDDLDRILSVIQEVCQQEGIPRERFQVGIMVEVPAVAIDAEPFLAKVDFLSIGTNDLVQYMFAASREDSHLDGYRLSHHPAILRLIHAVAAAAKKHGKPVSVCGEMASDPLQALLLIGLGIRNLSLQASALPLVRASIQKQSFVNIEALAREAMKMTRGDQVLELLQKVQAT